MITIIKFLFYFFSYKEESKTIKEHIDKGLLLSDELALKIVVDELEKIREKGFLLDGTISEIENRIVSAMFFSVNRLSSNIESS